jgi:hypothetical protein
MVDSAALSNTLDFEKSPMPVPCMLGVENLSHASIPLLDGESSVPDSQKTMLDSQQPSPHRSPASHVAKEGSIEEKFDTLSSCERQ